MSALPPRLPEEDWPAYWTRYTGARATTLPTRHRAKRRRQRSTPCG